MRRVLTLSVAALAIAAMAGGVFAQYSTKKETDHDTSDGHKHKYATIDHAAPDFTLVDSEGKKHELSKYKGKYVVLEWINLDCPFVKKHYDSGNMQGLQKKYTKEDVVWLSICSSGPGKQGDLETAEVKKRSEKQKTARTAYLIDSDGKVGRMYGAKTTPHMFIIDPKGMLIYAGGIDDKASTNKADIEKATNYVAKCLDAALAGKPVEKKTSTPYGCSVKYASKSGT